jgi:hypothetical protein
MAYIMLIVLMTGICYRQISLLEGEEHDTRHLYRLNGYDSAHG